MRNRTVAAALPARELEHRRHRDIPGAMLDELVRRLHREPAAFLLTEDGSWTSHSYEGDFTAHGDTLSDVVELMLPQIPVIRPRWSPA